MVAFTAYPVMVVVHFLLASALSLLSLIGFTKYFKTCLEKKFPSQKISYCFLSLIGATKKEIQKG
jgi:hypothetical protein